jgi:hypothetical protein
MSPPPVRFALRGRTHVWNRSNFDAQAERRTHGYSGTVVMEGVRHNYFFALPGSLLMQR